MSTYGCREIKNCIANANGNEKYGLFIYSLYLDGKTKTEEELSEGYLHQLIEKINNCLNFPSEDLVVALFSYRDDYTQKHFLSKINDIANRLWNEWLKGDYIYEKYQLEFLKYFYKLCTKLIYLDPVLLNEKGEKADIHDNTIIYHQIRGVLLSSTHGRTLKTILSVINTSNNPLTISSGLNELIMWLDIYTAFHQRYFYVRDSLDRKPVTVESCMLNEKYKNYLLSYKNTMNIDGIQKFYIGTCSLFCAHAYHTDRYDEELRWINLVEPLLFYLHRFILESGQIVESWTDDLLYCAVGVITLIANYYCLKRYNRAHPILHPRLFRRYEQFFQLLLNLLKEERFREQILPTWSNSETRLIDSILRYFLTVTTDFIEIKYFLRSLHAPAILVRYLRTPNTQINLNALYTLTIISTNDDMKNMNIAEELISIYLQLIENLNPQLVNSSSTESRQKNPSETQMKMHLEHFLLLSKYPSVQEAVGNMNAIRYFVEFPMKKEFGTVITILWTLLFHPLIQKQLKKDEYLLATLRKCHTEKTVLRDLLWTLGDHVGLANAGLANIESRTAYYDLWLKQYTNYDFILHFSDENTDIGQKISDHLSVNGYSALSDLSIDLLQLNVLESMKIIVICLSENYEGDLVCRAVLQYALKKQFIIIPTIIQKLYQPHGWIKEIFLETNMIDFTQSSFIDTFYVLLNTIKNSLRKLSEVSSDKTGIDHNNIQSQAISIDIFDFCKRNDTDKLRKYLQKMTVDDINRMDSHGDTALHLAVRYGHKRIIQLLLNGGASRSIRNSATNLTACENASTLEIKELFQRPNKTDRFLADSSDETFEWTLHYDDPSLQRSQFRRKLSNPFKVERKDVRTTLNTYQLSTIFREILTKFTENFFVQLPPEEISSNHKTFLDWFFKQTIDQANSTYILKAYTSTTNFYRVLNKTLAQFALEHFDAILQKSTDYKAVTSIMDLISLLIYDPQLDDYDYRGTTYRGMLLREEDLLRYTVGSKLMNISFVSTSTNRDVAEVFAGGTETSSLIESNNPPTQISAICIYNIKNIGTALNIEEISEISSESEVLLLPFSAFRIQCIRRLDRTVNKGITVELELEECDEYYGDNERLEKQQQLLKSLLHQQQ